MSAEVLLPGSVIGVVGGGQLGRYLVLEARRLGYDTWVLDPDATAPAMQLAAHTLVAAYDDADALDQLATVCDAVTTEFENVPAASLERLATHCHVAPHAAAVAVAQDRCLEKNTAAEHGLTPVPWAEIVSAEDIDPALASVALPAILKTSRLGYDGKGQQLCHSAEEVLTAFNAVDQVPCVLEQRIDLKMELSVVLARGRSGECQCFPVAENVHRNGILETSTVPSRASDAALEEVRSLAVRLAEGLDYHGVLAIEFFVATDGRVYFNEMAPRPHNSGHYTLDATVCSQFEQQLRALVGLPLGSVAQLSPVCMLNLLGDSWVDGDPDWSRVIGTEGAHLHLYGKHAARPGRKMGHINCLAESAAQARERAIALRDALARSA